MALVLFPPSASALAISQPLIVATIVAASAYSQ